MGFNPGGNSGISGATDVALNSVLDNEVLAYDSTTSKWSNASSANHQHTLEAISDMTAIGRSIASATNSTSVRTLISAWQPVAGTKTKVVQDFTDINAPRATSRTDVVIEWRGGPSQPTNMLVGVDEWTIVG